ncbi:MAG: hypothetical protein GX556_05865 [Fibrobacter sp.]|nr:hypothetical protein [Fibrobacter sp.]
MILRFDEQDKFRAHASRSLAVALRIEKDLAVIADVQKNPGPRNLHQLMAYCIRQMGRDPIGLSGHELYSMSIGSSDLPAVLENTINKAVSVGYNEAAPSFLAFTKEDETENFNPKKLIKMSNFSDIDDLPEGTPFKNKKLSDKYESIQVSTKGNVCTVTRQAMINDDTDSLSQIPRLMGAAVARRRNQDAYDLLTFNNLAGPLTNEDGKAVFHADHSNLIENSGTPSVSSIGAAERKLMEMPALKAEPGDSDSFMNLPARYLIAGAANKITINQLLFSGIDPNASISGVFNPYSAGAIIPVVDAYLQAKLTAAGKANAFYIAADKEMLPSLTICYLSGSREPIVRQEPSRIGAAQGITFEIYSDWGYVFEDFRGIIFNDGATAG